MQKIEIREEKKREKKWELIKELEKIRKEGIEPLAEKEIKVGRRLKTLNINGKRLVYTPPYYQEELNKITSEKEKKQDDWDTLYRTIRLSS